MRSLKDLYVRGSEVSLDDGSGDPIVVWVQKLNPIEHKHAVEKAGARRARILALKHNQESDDYQAIVSEALRSDHEELLDILAYSERSRIAQATWAEVADKAEWKDEDYLNGLIRSWQDELQEKFTEDPEDEDAARVHGELARFDEQVTKELDHRVEVFRSGLETMTDEEIHEMVVEHYLKLSADMVWNAEYMNWALFYAVRDNKDRRKRMFETREDLDELQLPVYTELRDALTSLTVDPVEGKDSAATPPSSTSSEPSAKAAA